MKNNLTSRPFVSIILIISFMASCATRHKAIPKSIQTIDVVNPYPIIHSQPKVKPAKKVKHINLDSIAENQYKRLAAPDIDRLYNIINSQAKTLKELAEYMSVTRHRTDSIVAERNYYRAMSNKKEAAYQINTIKLQKQLIAMQAKAQFENSKQIKLNTTMAIICLIGVGILAISTIALWYRVNKLYKKFVKYA